MQSLFAWAAILRSHLPWLARLHPHGRKNGVKTLVHVCFTQVGVFKILLPVVRPLRVYILPAKPFDFIITVGFVLLYEAYPAPRMHPDDALLILHHFFDRVFPQAVLFFRCPENRKPDTAHILVAGGYFHFCHITLGRAHPDVAFPVFQERVYIRSAQPSVVLDNGKTRVCDLVGRGNSQEISVFLSMMFSPFVVPIQSQPRLSSRIHLTLLSEMVVESKGSC